MKLTRLLALAAALSAPAAHAQIAEVYATANFTHISNIETGVVSTQTSSTYQFTSNTPVGIGGGATFNFLPLPVVKLGIDLRGSTRPGTVGADTALGGIKLTVKPPLLKIKPFIEGAVGYLATRTNNLTSFSTGTTTTISYSGTTFANDYAIYEIIGGVDYPLVHFVDFRVEAAGGSSFGDGNGNSILGNSTGGHAHIFTVNTGVVLHF